MTEPQMMINQRFGLCNLPAELRIRIYNFVFDSLPITTEDEDCATCEPAALLQACKQIFAEANKEFDRYLIARRLALETEITSIKSQREIYVQAVPSLEDLILSEQHVHACFIFQDQIEEGNMALEVIHTLRRKCSKRSSKTFGPVQSES